MPPAAMASSVVVAIWRDRAAPVWLACSERSVDQCGMGELGGRAEATPLGIEALGQLRHGGIEEFGVPAGHGTVVAVRTGPGRPS